MDSLPDFEELYNDLTGVAEDLNNLPAHEWTSEVDKAANTVKYAAEILGEFSGSIENLSTELLPIILKEGFTVGTDSYFTRFSDDNSFFAVLADVFEDLNGHSIESRMIGCALRKLAECRRLNAKGIEEKLGKEIVTE